MPKENLIGQKFNHWTVLNYAEEKSKQTKKTYWVCQCDCEFKTIQLVRQDQLKNNKSTRCIKCSHLIRAKSRVIDLTGEKHGRLTVLKQDKQRTNDGKIKWICQCDCGNICSIAGESLRANLTQSCGCLQKEKAAEIGKQRFDDLTNQTFGHLTALKFLRKEGHHSVWLCKCDCEEHNLVEVYNDNLKNGHTQSCGKCKGSGSFGEEAIDNLLTQNNIPFVREQGIKLNNVLYRFDFYINNQYIIEFDGIGHYKPTGGWNNQENVEATQKRDAIKNQWCKENNIPLIRIPYTHLKDLCLEDLLLETSKFIMKEEKYEIT